MFTNPILSRRLSTLVQSESPSLINSKIRSYVQQGLYTQALSLYTKKPNAPCTISRFTYPSLLKSCSSISNIFNGKIIHSNIIVLGLHFDPFIATSLVNLYVKCGLLDSAVHVFDSLSQCDVLCRDASLWNSMIDGYFKNGIFNEGLVKFREMQLLGVRPDGYSLSVLLGLPNGVLGCREGKQVHGFIVRNGLDGDPFLETALIGMYSGCGAMMDAWRVFGKLENKDNDVAWNAMIGGFCENGLWEKSLDLFCLMKKGDCKIGSVSFTGALSACAHAEDMSFGGQVHCDVIKTGLETDPYVCTSLLTMYAKSRLVEDARRVFYQTVDKKNEQWNAMIAAYACNGCAQDAIETYNRMRLSGSFSDSFTISNILSICNVVELGYLGRIIHGEIIKRPVQSIVAVQSALLTMYSKLGHAEEAYSVFRTMNQRDIVAWGSMISGFSGNLKFREAFVLYKTMEADGLVPDSDIMVSVIGVCVGLEDVNLGCGVHGFVLKNGLIFDVFIATSLIDMYSKHGLPDMAGDVFCGMSNKNIVSWNAIISCYSRNCLPDSSISLFAQIVENGLYPNSVSITSVLTAVSSVAALLKGKAIHGYQIRLEIPTDLQVKNALIDMYFKCGNIKYAQNIFKDTQHKNLVTWNLVIDGYGSHGKCSNAISLYDEMKLSGINPDNVTFLSLIASCSHSGLVEEGLTLFRSMREYGLEPTMEHYVNVVDLFGRAGRLDDAFNFIKDMPTKPDRSIWLCMLSACRVHRRAELGEIAANKLLEAEPAKGNNYTPLLNIYGDAEMWDKAAQLRVSMRKRGLKKTPGCSWIEVGNGMYVFYSGDSSFPKTVETYDTLNCLRRNMQAKEQKHFEGIEAF